MTANPIPGLQLPYPQTPTQQQNLQELQRWSKTVSPRLYAIEQISGAPTPAPPPSPSDAHLMVTGSQTVTFTSGIGTLTFAKPFPNGVISVMLQSIDNNTSIATVGFVPNNAEVLIDLNTPVGPIPSFVNFYYIAIGW